MEDQQQTDPQQQQPPPKSDEKIFEELPTMIAPATLKNEEQATKYDLNDDFSIFKVGDEKKQLQQQSAPEQDKDLDFSNPDSFVIGQPSTQQHYVDLNFSLDPLANTNAPMASTKAANFLDDLDDWNTDEKKTTTEQSPPSEPFSKPLEQTASVVNETMSNVTNLMDTSCIDNLLSDLPEETDEEEDESSNLSGGKKGDESTDWYTSKPGLTFQEEIITTSSVVFEASGPESVSLPEPSSPVLLGGNNDNNNQLDNSLVTSTSEKDMSVSETSMEQQHTFTEAITSITRESPEQQQPSSPVASESAPKSTRSSRPSQPPPPPPPAAISSSSSTSSSGADWDTGRVSTSPPLQDRQQTPPHQSSERQIFEYDIINQPAQTASNYDSIFSSAAPVATEIETAAAASVLPPPSPPSSSSWPPPSSSAAPAAALAADEVANTTTTTSAVRQSKSDDDDDDDDDDDVPQSSSYPQEQQQQQQQQQPTSPEIISNVGSIIVPSSASAKKVEEVVETKNEQVPPPSPPKESTTTQEVKQQQSPAFEAPKQKQQTTTTTTTTTMGRKNRRDNSSDDEQVIGSDQVKEYIEGVLGPNVAELVYWRDLKNSGVVFGLGLVILFSLSIFSVISVVAYTLFFTQLASLSFRVYKNVMQAVQKTGEGHPFKEYLDIQITPSQERVHEIVESAIVHGTAFINRLRSVLLVEDIVDSLKYLLIFWAFTYIGAWFNGLTVLILLYLAAFSLPLVYEQNRSQIDQYLELVNGKIAEVVDKIPLLKKTASVVPEPKKDE